MACMIMVYTYTYSLTSPLIYLSLTLCTHCAETITPDFQEFLDFLGSKVSLKGWDKFRGGLDISESATTGIAIYSVNNGFIYH